MSFEFILPELLISIPFFIGYTRPSYKSNKTLRDALMRAEMYQENVDERVEWEKYQEKAKKEERKSAKSSILGSVVGSIIGFFTGGPTGAKIGWNAGKAIGRQIRKGEGNYFDGEDWLSGNKILRGGKYNRAIDRERWKSSISDAEDIERMRDYTDMLNIG